MEQVGDQCWESIILTFCISIYDPDILALDIASFFQPVVKSCAHVRRRTGRTRLEESDHRHRRLLRARRERPCHRRPAEQRYERASM
jgi:hypothetical protein